MDIIEINKQADTAIKSVRHLCGNLEQAEDSNMKLHPPETGLIQSISKMGMISTSGYAPLYSADGEDLTKAKFSVLVKDQVGEHLALLGDGVRWSQLPDQNLPGKVLLHWSLGCPLLPLFPLVLHVKLDVSKGGLVFWAHFRGLDGLTLKSRRE